MKRNRKEKHDMGQTFTGALDAETGVYKSHALSAELLKLAALKFKIVPFTRAMRQTTRIDSYSPAAPVKVIPC